MARDTSLSQGLHDNPAMLHAIGFVLAALVSLFSWHRSLWLETIGREFVSEFAHRES
jgi:hypothetical protein